jgi:hypothetical protein
MTKHMKSLVAGAAFAGLLTGTAATALAASRANGNTLGQEQSKEKKSKTEKHACKGKNSCKGKGGCKSGDNGCKGKNSCKGKGGCATDGSKPPSA